jgi:outer membrane protein assembly factor BamB
MTGLFKFSGLVAALVFTQGAIAGEAWRLEGFDAPESALIGPDGKTLYVSVIAGGPGDKDGNGYIAKLSIDGSLLEDGWATGLDAPKGLVIRGDTLFVSDIDRLVAIDLATGGIGGSWPAEGAVFLNDTAVDGDGRVYVSDMLANRIHVLEDDTLSVFVEGDGLMHPNGLAVADGKLIVAAWGDGLRDDFTTETPGHLISVDLATKEISALGSGTPVGNLDGLEPDGAGSWLVTDWISGALYRISPDGAFDQLLDLPPGSADLEYLSDGNMVIIPLMLDGQVLAETLD